ncbi:protocatechuate 3,4-dioxygenase subunit alpha [uncultured Jatrophihabitans sp.]|uniref:protocatechuate 3,4-dioxygenase subunit alpha n=1 Tax=uncultured Jatrophihabitans sp. TaxID=1610747 RepID=UPI0035CA56C5
MSTERGTAGQTVGPFFGTALPYAGGAELVPRAHPDAVHLHGRVLDGAGVPVPDAMLEIWQPAQDGSVPATGGSLHRDGWTFTGWGRAATDGAGNYSFSTVVPALPPSGGLPFLAMTVFARGLLDRLLTRVYLPTPDRSTGDDAFLSSLPDERRGTLLAEPDEQGFRFDVVLQGHNETVFLDFRNSR